MIATSSSRERYPVNRRLVLVPDWSGRSGHYAGRSYRVPVCRSVDHIIGMGDATSGVRAGRRQRVRDVVRDDAFVRTQAAG
jgi:hypothetical protein